MISLRKSEERGHTKIDWLDSYHSFSFGEYYDPQHVHFGPLRVFNDDTVAAMGGFPTHPHKNMEIVSIVTLGRMAHGDSTGSQGIIKVNDVQRMTAGKGVYHSEFNASDNQILKFFQVWFIPNETDLTPSYEQISFDPEERKNKLQLIVSGNVNDGVVFINQDAKMYLSDLEKGNKLRYITSSERGVYIHVADGAVDINGYKAEPGDAIKITEETEFEISASEKSSFILFDMTLNV